MKCMCILSWTYKTSFLYESCKTWTASCDFRRASKVHGCACVGIPLITTNQAISLYHVVLPTRMNSLRRRVERSRWAVSNMKTKTFGFDPSRSKTWYMECKFCKKHTNTSYQVKVGEQTISQVSHFKYFRPIIQNDGEIAGDIDLREMSITGY